MTNYTLKQYANWINEVGNPIGFESYLYMEFDINLDSLKNENFFIFLKIFKPDYITFDAKVFNKYTFDLSEYNKLKALNISDIEISKRLNTLDIGRYFLDDRDFREISSYVIEVKTIWELILKSKFPEAIFEVIATLKEFSRKAELTFVLISTLKPIAIEKEFEFDYSFEEYDKWQQTQTTKQTIFDYMYDIFKSKTIHDDLMIVGLKCMWLDFVEIDTMIFFQLKYDETRYKSLSTQYEGNRTKIETWLNIICLDGWFNHLAYWEDMERFGKEMGELLKLKLQLDYPNIEFQIIVDIDKDVDDVLLSFFQK